MSGFSGEIALRPGRIGDVAHMTLLVDAASRRMTSWFWSTMSVPGQSYFEVGRHRIMTKSDSPSYYTNWWMAEIGGEIAGGLSGFSVPSPYDPGDVSDLPDVFRPLLELEEIAAGCWQLNIASIYPEYRSKGLGAALLARAAEVTRGTGHRRMNLMVESANARGHAFYLRNGFSEWARRPFVSFPGSDDTGDWILMVKDV